MNPRSPLTLLILILLLMAALAPLHPALADTEGDEDDERAGGGEEEGDDEDEDERHRWEREEREMEVRLEEDGFRYESRRDTQAGRDEMRLDFDLEEGELELSFQAEAEGTQREIEFLIEDWVLLEYHDTDGDGRLGGDEPVHTRIRLEDLDDRRLDHERIGGVERLRASYGLPGGGAWSLVFHMTPRTTQLGETVLLPTQVKFDIMFEDFPYALEGSQLAVRFRLESSIEVEVEEGDAPALVASERPFHGVFQWAQNVSVDGADRNVETSVSRTLLDRSDEALEEETAITFHYPRGDRIVHDPLFGFRLAPSGQVVDTVQDVVGDLRFIGVGLAAGMVVVLLTLAPRSRRKTMAEDRT